MVHNTFKLFAEEDINNFERSLLDELTKEINIFVYSKMQSLRN